jgi:hypothetical protein
VTVSVARASVTTQETGRARDLFARHLDLAPLRGKRRGLVRCIWHEDRTPSFSVDLDKLIFYCHSCGVGGGYKRFAELVGEVPSRRTRITYISPLDEARHDVLTRERAAAARRNQFRPLMIASDNYRHTMRAVGAVRWMASVLGPEVEDVWSLLEDAAYLETSARAELAEVTA